jgi:DNA replication protein DnaD
VLELISHCLNRKGPRVSMTYMDAVARAWADAGVRTAEDAKAQAAAHEEMTGGAATILKRWNKSRRPTKDELDLYEKWTKGWGFTPEAVLAACPAVTSADHPSFKYLDGLLERLYREGTTAADAVARLLDTEDKSADLAREVFSRMGMGRAARPLERAQLSGFLEAGLPMDVLLFAAEQSAGKERAFGYCKSLLKEFLDNGANTPAAAQAHMDARVKSTSGNKRINPALDYPQKRYTEEELKHLFINLDEEA